jgi:hypothetical protein
MTSSVTIKGRIRSTTEIAITKLKDSWRRHPPKIKKHHAKWDKVKKNCLEMEKHLSLNKVLLWQNLKSLLHKILKKG